MSTQIYVGNMNYKMTNDSLKRLFETYGEVTSAKVVMDRETNRSKGFGFVEMENKDEAEAAVNALNEKDIDGRKLKVNFARPKNGK